MEEDQEYRSHERVRVMAEVVGLPIDEARIPALAAALDGTRLMLAQLDPLADSVEGPVLDVFDPAWTSGSARS